MRDFSNAKRIVVKVGTNILRKDEGINSAYVRRISRQLSNVVKAGRQVLLVSSGAIGMGADHLQIHKRITEANIRQACAAIGQPLLMQEYRKCFLRHGVTVAQVLLTTEVLNNRKTYLNLRNSVETLLRLGVVPVINENDSVSTEEIGTAFGDNDRLSAFVASKIDADLLLILSDIDALYDKDPRKHPDAKPIWAVYEVTDKMIRDAGGRGSEHATGGMRTKLQAAQIASNAGCRMVLADGMVRDVVERVLGGAQLGTVFMPRRKLGNRQRWIINSTPRGRIQVDEGAMRALRKRKSLLPSGIVSVKGSFNPGSVVNINDTCRAVTSLSSSQLRKVAGRHSSQIEKLLGPGHRDVVAIPEDIVFLD